jgi:predicted phosphoribosyltransferase
MKPPNRRHFLGTAALSQSAIHAAQNRTARKRVLVTSGHCRLAQTIADELRAAYQVRLTERIPVRTHLEFVLCALASDAETAALVRGVDAIVHVAESLPGEGDAQRIDYLTHRTYNLLMAASAEMSLRASV